MTIGGPVGLGLHRQRDRQSAQEYSCEPHDHLESRICERGLPARGNEFRPPGPFPPPPTPPPLRPPRKAPISGHPPLAFPPRTPTWSSFDVRTAGPGRS